MESLVLARFMVRGFGLFLLAASVGKLPNVIYTLVTGEYSSFTHAFFAGAVPYFIPPVVGLLLFWNPDGMLRMPRAAAPPSDDRMQLNLEEVAISLLGMYWLVLGVIDTLYQLAWGVITREDTGRFFSTYDAMADSISAVLELAVGSLLVYHAARIQAKLAAWRGTQRE
ncbi:MAG: hypothetical protein Q8L45_02760 [Xanthomonadaceae bacterium]|nr:hypothetical protein [Xanthomonadaceae bacterium]MDZ4114877.1 hypothetical protein [Xanthomonadaceae bacterium]MDZ4376989.1 hypothetical protein [Xanthomonadaceae bacterium]